MRVELSVKSGAKGLGGCGRSGGVGGLIHKVHVT